MATSHENRNEAALYWSAVSLIVCEGLSIDKAAERLGVETEELRTILHRRQALRPFHSSPNSPTPPSGLLQ
jgi:predicted HTH domain antitoxin